MASQRDLLLIMRIEQTELIRKIKQNGNRYNSSLFYHGVRDHILHKALTRNDCLQCL